MNESSVKTFFVIPSEYVNQTFLNSIFPCTFAAERFDSGFSFAAAASFFFILRTSRISASSTLVIVSCAPNKRPNSDKREKVYNKDK